jgi:hypothetical protein
MYPEKYHTPVIPAFRMQRLLDFEFKVSLDYIVRPCLKKTHIQNASVEGHACKPSIQEAEAGRSQVQGWPRLYRETLTQKKKDKPVP